MFTPELTGVKSAAFGVAYGYTNAESDWADNHSVESKTHSATASAGMNFDNGAYVDAALAYGWVSYDLDRTLMGRSYSGDTDGDYFAASGRVGYDMEYATGDATIVWKGGPFLSGQYVSGNVDSFTEASADDPEGALTTTSFDYDTGAVQIGGRVQVSRRTETASLGLTFSAAYERVFGEDSSDDIFRTTVGSATLGLTGYDDDNRFRAGLRFSVAFDAGTTIALEYNGAFSGDLDNHSVKALIRTTF